MVIEKMWIGDTAYGHREEVDIIYSLWYTVLPVNICGYGIRFVVTKKIWIGDTAYCNREDVDKGYGLSL